MGEKGKVADEKSDIGIHSPNYEKESQSIPIDYGVLSDAALERNGTKLHPRPTSDKLDPLNWSSLQKHTILGIVMLK